MVLLYLDCVSLQFYFSTWVLVSLALIYLNTSLKSLTSMEVTGQAYFRPHPSKLSASHKTNSNSLDNMAWIYLLCVPDCIYHRQQHSRFQWSCISCRCSFSHLIMLSAHGLYVVIWSLGVGQTREVSGLVLESGLERVHDSDWLLFSSWGNIWLHREYQ